MKKKKTNSMLYFLLSKNMNKLLGDKLKPQEKFSFVKNLINFKKKPGHRKKFSLNFNKDQLEQIKDTSNPHIIINNFMINPMKVKKTKHRRVNSVC